MTADADARVDAERARKANTGIWLWGAFLAIAALFMFAARANKFLPDNAASSWTYTISLLLDALIVAAAWYGIWVLTLRKKRISFRTAWLAFIPTCVLHSNALAGQPGMRICAAGFLYPEIWKTPSVRQLTVEEWEDGAHSLHLHLCHGVVLYRDPLELLCSNSKIAPGTVLTLYGKQSALGFDIARWTY